MLLQLVETDEMLMELAEQMDEIYLVQILVLVEVDELLDRTVKSEQVSLYSHTQYHERV